MAVASRTIRRQLSKRQADVADASHSRRFVHDLENGLAGQLRVDDLRTFFAGFGASLRVTVYWNGAQLDRLVDQRHADIVELAVARLRRAGWTPLPEVTFADFGERGSIDVLAVHEEANAAFIGEVKSEWGSIEETNRSLDVKVRLAPKICFARLGWRPLNLAKVLILPDEGSSRRISARYRETLDAVYPARTVDVRRWLRRPDGPLSAIWFLPNVTPA